MPLCPFAIQRTITGGVGPYSGGPFKIVLHTTEGTSAIGAFAAFRASRSDPHFVVDDINIYQLIDTSEAARSLRNASGGVETNRDSAIQIEMVGFAGRPKSRAVLANTKKLCEWIEETHHIPRVWPSGHVRPPNNGADPGGHNRDPINWDTKGGYYGHSQVPENTHWDPALTEEETNFLTAAEPIPVPTPPGVVGDIGWAVKQMWNGYKVVRSGWNGKGMYLMLQRPDVNSKMTLPYVYMNTVDGNLVPWLCSQTDLLAVDWAVVT